MPRYRVKSPDGRTFYVNAPEGATQEQVLAYARKNAPASKPRNPGTGIGIFDRALSGANEFLIGAAQGVENIGAALTDPLAALVLGKDTVKQAQQQRKGRWDTASRAIVSRPDATSRTVGRIAGAMAVPVPKIPGAGAAIGAANRAIQGAIGGAAVRDSDESALQPAAIGAAANVALPPALSALARTRPVQAATRAIGNVLAPVARPLVSAADDAAEKVLSIAGPRLGVPYSPPVALPPSPVQAAAPLAALGRDAQVRAARFRAAGVDNPTSGMVTREPRTWNFERETSKLHGVGDDLQGQIRDVERTLIAKGREMVNQQGGARGAEATGRSVQDALDAKRAEMQQVTSKLYDRVREARGEEAVGTLGGLRDTLRHPDMADNAVLDSVRAGVIRRLSRLGLTDDAGSAIEGKAVTVKQAEELRKFIGGLGDARDPTVRMARGQLIDALDDDVVNAVGDDAFKIARESAKARFQEFSRTFSGRLADERIAPEALTRRVLGDGVRLSELRSLRKSLTTGTPEQIARGKEAWQGMRAQALDDLLGGATNPDGQLNGGALYRSFSKQAPKFRELLGPQDFKTLRRLVLASRDATVEPPMASVNYSNTASTLANMFNRAPKEVRQNWIKLLAKHGAAYAAVGPPGNIALEVGSRAVASTAEQRAANEMIRRVQLARNPEEMAAAVRAAQEAAKSNAALAELLQRFQNFAGQNPAVGGAAAAAARE